MQSPNPKRKSLEDLLNDPEAQAFVHKQVNAPHADTPTSQHVDMPARQPVEERISVSVKVPKRIADALWQAMHERNLEQKKKRLASGEPYEKQGIVSQALERWLMEKGYLK
jgi:hypothetical protein